MTLSVWIELLQNSIDYFENSLEAYIEADENGEYGNYSDINKKKRWKVAAVFICQALELIFKNKLQTINEILVFDNIDANITSGYFKTIDASKTIVRLKNLKELNLSNEEGEFVQNCFKIRNRFIHYNVEIDYEKIKSQYAKLVAIYEKIYNQYAGKDSFQFGVNKRDLFNKAMENKKHQDLVNYLVHMEGVAALVNNGVLRILAINDLMAYHFFIAVNNPVVQEL